MEWNSEQLYRAALLRGKVVCLTSRVAQIMSSWATKLLDRNHFYFSAISRSVAESIVCLLVFPYDFFVFVVHIV